MTNLVILVFIVIGALIVGFVFNSSKWLKLILEQMKEQNRLKLISLESTARLIKLFEEIEGPIKRLDNIKTDKQ